jgi:large subunit ribosomal protein L29
MNYKEVLALTDKQREEKRKEIELELMKERAQVASGTAAKNPGMIREHRRTLARFKTFERQNQ